VATEYGALHGQHLAGNRVSARLSLVLQQAQSAWSHRRVATLLRRTTYLAV